MRTAAARRATFAAPASTFSCGVCAQDRQPHPQPFLGSRHCSACTCHYDRTHAPCPCSSTPKPYPTLVSCAGICRLSMSAKRCNAPVHHMPCLHAPKHLRVCHSAAVTLSAFTSDWPRSGPAPCLRRLHASFAASHSLHMPRCHGCNVFTARPQHCYQQPSSEPGPC